MPKQAWALWAQAPHIYPKPEQPAQGDRGLGSTPNPPWTSVSQFSLQRWNRYDWFFSWISDTKTGLHLGTILHNNVSLNLSILKRMSMTLALSVFARWSSHMMAGDEAASLDHDMDAWFEQGQPHDQGNPIPGWTSGNRVDLLYSSELQTFRLLKGEE